MQSVETSALLYVVKAREWELQNACWHSGVPPGMAAFPVRRVARLLGGWATQFTLQGVAPRREEALLDVAIEVDELMKWQGSIWGAQIGQELIVRGRRCV